MKRLVGGLLALLVLVAVVLIGRADLESSGSASNEVSRITAYDAEFTLDEDGDLEVVERLTVDFPTYRHGIFRFFDLRDPNDSHARLKPRDIEVSRDGIPEEFEVLREHRGRYRTVKIGDADRTITGSHLYAISYRIDTVLLPRKGDTSEFFWDLIPAGWLMPIAGAHLTVHLPADAIDPQCAVGQGASGGCTATGSGDDLVITTGALAPNTPVTLKTGVDQAAPDRKHTLPWAQSWDPVLGSSKVALLVVLLLAGLAALLGLRVTRSTLEKTPGLPLTYAPPEGIGPAQAAYLLDERVSDEAMVASLMYAAEKGAVTLDQSGGDWTVTSKDPAAWDALDPVTHQLGSSLGVVNGTFTVARRSVSAGQHLKDTVSTFKTAVKGWARVAGLMSPSGLGPFGVFVIGALVVATGFLAIANPLDMSAVALVPGMFVVTGLGAAFSGAGTRRTPSGRELWSRVGGFHRILATPSAQARFDFSGRKELYTAYLPWAVAFGCADEWAKKYRVETGEEPPVPTYFGGYYGAHTGNFVNQMVGSFNDTVSGAISAYQATQRSSSSGGGGGFGGGGGGGGGGGSW